MNDRDDRPSVAGIFKVGTPECAIFSCVAAVGVGLLLLTAGFWNTLWISLLGALGAFLGGVSNKKEIVKSVLNRLIPDKKTVLYREQHPDIVKAVKDAVAKQESSREGEGEPEPEREQEQE